MIPLATSPTHVLTIGAGVLSAVSVLAIAWVIGNAVIPQRPQAERLAAGLGGVLLVAWATMAQPIVGVSLLGHHRLSALLGAAGVAALAARARGRLLDIHVSWGPVIAFLVPAAIVSWPLVRSPLGSPVFYDMRFHEGWIRQLLGGLGAPGGTYADTPSDYPWLYHSLAAWLSMLPGDLNAMLWGLQAVAVLALGVGAWLLARELGASVTAASWTMFIATGAGGVGWLWVHKPVAYTGAQAGANYHGDFTVSSAVTPAMGALAPVLPRDVAVALTPLALWLCVRAVTGRSRRVAACAGAMVAAVILMGPVAGVVTAAIAGGLALLYRAPWRLAATAGAAAVAGLAIWFGPFIWHYLEFGGLGSDHGRPSATVSQAAVGMGLLLPLGLVGLALAIRNRPAPTTRALMVIVGVPGLLCVVAAALHGSGVLGVAPISRMQRYLPLFAVCLTPPAGVGAAWLVERTRAGRWAIGAGLAGAMLISTMLSSEALASRFYHLGDVVFRCHPNAGIEAQDTVAIAGLRHGQSTQLGDAVFRWTGATTLYRDHPAHERFKKLFDSIPSQEQRLAWIQAIEQGQPPPDSVAWVLMQRSATPGSTLDPVSECAFVSLTGTLVKLRLYRPAPPPT